MHEIEEGDRRKFVAASNDADTGGGARDLRYRPEPLFVALFGRMFVGRRTERRKHDGLVRSVEVCYGPIKWLDPHREWRDGVLEAWPRTPTRNEARLARVHEFGFDALVEDDPNGGKSVFILTQTEDGSVYVSFTTETAIRRDDEGDAVLKAFAVDWLNRRLKSGFIDLETGERFPDA
ncbi:MAG: hypothetical protein KIT43_13035 [Bauldia sp.]|nr:hypothetical protein [Bauldia sp.]MCW5717055.1 hypothetical protein [Bauldia sp.]